MLHTWCRLCNLLFCSVYLIDICCSRSFTWPVLLLTVEHAADIHPVPECGCLSHLHYYKQCCLLPTFLLHIFCLLMFLFSLIFLLPFWELSLVFYAWQITFIFKYKYLTMYFSNYLKFSVFQSYSFIGHKSYHMLAICWTPSSFLLFLSSFNFKCLI